MVPCVKVSIPLAKNRKKSGQGNFKTGQAAGFWGVIFWSDLESLSTGRKAPRSINQTFLFKFNVPFENITMGLQNVSICTAHSVWSVRDLYHAYAFD